MQDIYNIVEHLHLEDLKNASHPSTFDENDKYDMLILRLPMLEQDLDVISIGFIITDEKSYIYDREKQAFIELESRFESPYEILDKMIDHILNSFQLYLDLIVDMEEDLYLNKTNKSFMKQWLKLKHNIVRIERILIHASSTMNKTIGYYENNSDFPINHYIDLHEHLERTIRSATLQLSKLDYLYSFYSAQTNERMNYLIYTLTIISAVFLPLNLVVGFFGMNTSGLPFSGGTSGTTNVVALISILSVITIATINFVRKRGR